MATLQRTKATAKSRTDAPKATSTASVGVPHLSPDSIAQRAYELWRESGCAHGNDKAHWFRAEQELRGRTTLR